MPSALDIARTIEPELIDIRRDIHRNPEVAWEEVRTSGIAADACSRSGLKVLRGAAKTGTVAILNPEKHGHVLALRADMDALPIQEENEVSYKSVSAGKGHLCGHDAHTAMLIGAAKILSRYKDRIPFQIRFIFQPAEELPPGGAKLMLSEGHLNGVSEIMGLHVNPLLPTGCLGFRTGAFMASMDKLVIDLNGDGGHAAMPHLCHDPVLAAAELVVALQSIVSRRVDPLEPAVVSICQINAGSAFNVIPPRAQLVGTVRTLSASLRARMPEWIEQIANHVAACHGQTARIEYIHGTPVLVNQKEAVENLTQEFRVLGGVQTEIKATMGGEDFAFYLEKIPGCFAFLGAGNGSLETSHCFHHPRYNIDERALAWGTALFVQYVAGKAGISL